MGFTVESEGKVSSPDSAEPRLYAAVRLGREPVTPPHWHIAPYFIVNDVVTTANFYRDKLGFHYERFWNEPPSFCMVKRSGIIIMLAQLDAPTVIRPNRHVDPEGSAWDAYIWIENADTLAAEFRTRGVPIAREICDQVYGCRDFEIDDCNGYRLCFGHVLAG
jgi:predicted enzyme related to lactoylglutathione lyase